MTTELIERPTEAALLLTVTPETVKTLAARCLSLKVNGIDDAEGLARVKDALRECVSARTTCEKEIAAVKEPHLRACQVCDKTRRDILALIAEPEAHLKDQAQVIEREKARQAQAERDALIEFRRNLLAEAGGNRGLIPDDLLGRMGQIEFDMALGNARRDAQERKEAEARKAKEAEQLRADQARLQAERAEFEQRQREEEARRQAELKQLQDMRAKLAEETRRIQAEEAERTRLAQAERAARDRAEREAREAEANEKAAAEAQRKAEAMRPDREKLRTVAAALAEIDVPEVGPDAQPLANQIAAIVEKARYEIVQLLKEQTR